MKSQDNFQSSKSGHLVSDLIHQATGLITKTVSPNINALLNDGDQQNFIRKLHVNVQRGTPLRQQYSSYDAESNIAPRDLTTPDRMGQYGQQDSAGNGHGYGLQVESPGVAREKIGGRTKLTKRTPTKMAIEDLCVPHADEAEEGVEDEYEDQHQGHPDTAHSGCYSQSLITYICSNASETFSIPSVYRVDGR